MQGWATGENGDSEQTYGMMLVGRSRGVRNGLAPAHMPGCTRRTGTLPGGARDVSESACQAPHALPVGDPGCRQVAMAPLKCPGSGRSSRRGPSAIEGSKRCDMSSCPEPIHRAPVLIRAALQPLFPTFSPSHPPPLPPRSLPKQNDMDLGEIQGMQPALYHRYNVVDEGDDEDEDEDDEGGAGGGYKGTSMFEATGGVGEEDDDEDKMGGGGGEDGAGGSDGLTEALHSMNLRDRELLAAGGEAAPMEDAEPGTSAHGPGARLGEQDWGFGLCRYNCRAGGVRPRHGVTNACPKHATANLRMPCACVCGCTPVPDSALIEKGQSAALQDAEAYKCSAPSPPLTLSRPTTAPHRRRARLGSGRRRGVAGHQRR